MGDSTVPLGGYFELELASGYELPYSDKPSYFYQSARAAFRALLSAVKPTKVWLPSYLCYSMISAVVDQHVEVGFYSQTSLLELGTVEIAVDEIILIVNYFGLHDDQVNKILALINRQQVVVDNSQAFFSSPTDCLATLYSPRKFLGVPDGGILITSCPIAYGSELISNDSASLNRSHYLLKRLALGAEAGYADYQAAEASLADTTPRLMSSMTKALLCSINGSNISKRRRENYLFLSQGIGSLNRKHIELPENAVPLCYPFVSDNEGLRPALIKRKIFVATYWPDVLDRVSSASTEASFVHRILPLPIDQRYSPENLKRVVDVFNDLF